MNRTNKLCALQHMIAVRRALGLALAWFAALLRCFVIATKSFAKSKTSMVTPILFSYVATMVGYVLRGAGANRVAAQTGEFSDLRATLLAMRAGHKLPALGAAIITSDGVQALATVGARKRGETVPVTDQDLWHLASDSKAMTATMIARLVERGQMKWTQTLGETFPERAANMGETMKAITRTHLLAH